MKKRELKFLPYILLVSLGWLVFGQAIYFDFFNYDDYDYLFHTPFLNQPWSFEVLGQILGYVGTGNWHPLVWISLKLDGQIFGPGPFGYHFTNVLLHLLNGVLLFAILRKWTGYTWRSFFVSVIFLVHPQRAESVAWIVERKDVLSGFFFMLTLWSYTKYAQHFLVKKSKKVLGWYLLTLILFALGLLSKSMLITVPFLMLLLDYWPLKRQASFSIRTLEKIPFFILIMISSYMAIASRAGISLDINVQVPFAIRFLNSIVFYACYIRDSLFPYNVMFYRLYPFEGIAPVWIGLSTVLLLFVSTFTLAMIRKIPALFVGWTWFLGMLVPVIGFIHVAYSTYPDRYTYLPSIGFWIMIVWFVCLVFEDDGEKKDFSSKLFIPIICIAICYYSFLGWRQVSLWSSSEKVYRHSLKLEPHNYQIQEALCDYLFEERRYKEAIRSCSEAVEKFPERALASKTLGRIFFRQTRFSASRSYFEHMLKVAMMRRFENEIDRDEKVQKQLDEFNHIYQGLISRKKAEHPFYVLGNFWAKHQFNRLAVEAYQKALNLSPKHVPAHVNVANVYFLSGQVALARKHFQIAIQLEEDDLFANYNYGLFLNSLGENQEAQKQYEKVFGIDPSHEGAKKMLRKLKA